MFNRIKELLYGNVDMVTQLLEDVGYCKIKTKNNGTLKFAFDEESDGSCEINVDTLSFTRWSTGEHGDIFTAISIKGGFNVGGSISWLCNKLGMENCGSVDKVERIPKSELFGGLLGRIGELEGKRIYNNMEVDKFSQITSIELLNDGIDIYTQDVFDIRYDEDTDRIIYLWKDDDGNVVGCNARANYDDYGNYKFLSLLKFNKGEFLFGLSENKGTISNTSLAVIFESEKSVMQAYSFGMYNSVAVGCSSITKAQVNLLVKNGVSNVILGFDEDKDLAHNVNVAHQIKEWCPSINVSVIHDSENKVLAKGSKSSPTDMGKDIFLKMMSECMIKM